MQKVRKAVFPVGGLGTRFLPATKSMPKEMLTVGSKPLIQHAYEEAKEAGIEEFIFVTGRNKYSISNHFDNAYELESTLKEKNKLDALDKICSWMPEAGQIALVRQQKPLGLGHAVWCARNLIGDEPFAVILADELFLSQQGLLSQMVDIFNETGGNIIAAADIDPENTHKYGIIDPEEDNGTIIKVKSMVEKPESSQAPSNISITGRYILQPHIFDFLSSQEKGSGGEIQLTDAMQKMIKEDDFYGVRFKGQRFDCGSQVGFLEANIAYALEDSSLRDRVSHILKKYSAS